ncbi:MAG: DUF1015 domain-containing protein [Deltaproteobacteria bacterium]|nr:DUF1015 domain-containing protein [Deltaproteobacteria bacterium]
MPKIKAFRGIRYNPEKVSIENVLCPPYDVITPKQSEEYHKKDPHNAIGLVLGRQLLSDSKKDNRYTRARDIWNKWRQVCILKQDSIPAIYYHKQGYRIGDKTYTRTGFISIVHIDEEGGKNILPHENTHKGPKLDRLHLMKETKANLSCIFGIYSDPAKVVSSQIKPYLKEPEIDITTEEGYQKLWVIDDSEIIKKVSNVMVDKTIFIADGHHRYETAKAYRDRKRISTRKKDGDQPFDYVMMYLSNIDDGITVLPTHRVIIDSMGTGLVELEYKIKEVFNMIPFDNRAALLNALNEKGKGHLGLFVKGIPRYYMLKLINEEFIERFMPEDTPSLLKKLDVTILHKCILEPILGIDRVLTSTCVSYISDSEQTLDMVEKGQADIAFLLNPPSIQEIVKIAKAGLRVPQKSTFFYPKIPTGLVFYSLEG